MQEELQDKNESKEARKEELENLKGEIEEELITLAAKKIELLKDINKLQGSIDERLDLSTSENRKDQQSIPKQNLVLLSCKKMREIEINYIISMTKDKKELLLIIDEELKKYN